MDQAPSLWPDRQWDTPVESEYIPSLSVIIAPSIDFPKREKELSSPYFYVPMVLILMSLFLIPSNGTDAASIETIHAPKTHAVLPKEEAITPPPWADEVKTVQKPVVKKVIAPTTPKPKPITVPVAPLTHYGLLRLTSDLPIYKGPTSFEKIGTLHAKSVKLGLWQTVPVLDQTATRSKILIPWDGKETYGWVDAKPSVETNIILRVSLRARRMWVYKSGQALFSLPVGIGTSQTPTMRGWMYITDPTPVPASQPQFGSYAWGLSEIQTHLPSGWNTWQNQLAIHGTNASWSIGQAQSTGCLRISAAATDRLQPYLSPGTLVVVS